MAVRTRPDTQMPATAEGAPLARRLASRVAGVFGVQLFTLLYGEKPLLGNIERIEPSLEIRIRRAGASELEHLLQALPEGQADIYGTARANEADVWIAWHGGEMAGYTWANRHAAYLLNWRLLDLPAGGAFTFNNFVLPRYRGCRIAQCLSQAVYSDLKADGYSFCCHFVDRNNAASIAARSKFGFNYRPAPVLKLPGCRPLLLARRLRVGSTVEGREAQ